MRLGDRIRVLAWLIGDTFRQSLASYICWLMLGVSAVAIAVCISVQVDGSATIHRPGERPDFLPRNDPQLDFDEAEAHGVDVVAGNLSIAFGAVTLPIARDAYDAVRHIQLILAGLVADTAGVLLVLTWTAAFLPVFLEPRSVAVLLVKPVPRSAIIIGKYLGVVVFVLLQATIFVLGTWTALGMRTGIWDPSYLLCVPILLMHFLVFFAFSVLLAVCTRSTIICVIGSLAFWGVCWCMNFGRHALVAAKYVSPETSYSGPIRVIVEIGYWVLPKPADFQAFLFDILHGERFFSGMSAIRVVVEHGEFSIVFSTITSLLYAGLVLVAAAQQFNATDY